MSLFEIFGALVFTFMLAMMCFFFGVLFLELGQNGIEESFKRWKRIFKKKMSKELKCQNCQQKDKEIAKLKEALEIQKNLTRQACFESNRAYDEAEKWKKMFYDLVYNQSTICTDPNIVIIGKDTDVLANGTDNNVGSIKEKK